MKTRKFFNFILVLLIVTVILPMTQVVTVEAKRREYSDGNPENLEHPYNWVDYSSNDVETDFLKKQKKTGSKNDSTVNYYTIREMVLNNKYDSEILSKKYKMMDKFFRFYAQFNDARPFFDTESKQIVMKVGIVDKIWELDDGSVVFTLTDNPTKRFYIMPGYDYFHFRYVTEPGDKVSLLTTTDRIVYEFDNYNLTRGQEVNYKGYMNYRHPEDMIISGFFPSKLYQERLKRINIHIENWLQLMLEYVDVKEEQYYGYADYMSFSNINSNSIGTVEDYYRMKKSGDSIAEELKLDNYSMQDSNNRRFPNGFDYDSVDDFLLSSYGEIREIKTNNNGETMFTLWENPTRWFYMSKYYDPLYMGNITKPGDEVWVIHTVGKIVYGFNNKTIFGDFKDINNPNFLKDSSKKTNVNLAKFWRRVNKLPKEKQKKYETLGIKNND